MGKFDEYNQCVAIVFIWGKRGSFDVLYVIILYLFIRPLKYAIEF